MIKVRFLPSFPRKFLSFPRKRESEQYKRQADSRFRGNDLHRYSFNRYNLNCSRILSSLIFSIFIFSLNVATSHASSIIEELKKRTIDAESVTGNFIQHKRIKGLSIPLISKGTFSYKKEDKLVWDIKAPIKNIYSIEYDQITQKSSVENMVEGLEAPTDHYHKIITMFLDLFSGNWGVLEKYFIIEGESSEFGWKAELTPKDQLFQTMFQSLILRGDKYINFMQIEETNGDKTEIEFKQVKVIAAADKSSLKTEEE